MKSQTNGWNTSEIIKVDRLIPFNPEAYIGVGWSIANQDTMSLPVTDINLDKLEFELGLSEEEKKNGEFNINGETRIERLKLTNHILLDAMIWATLFDNYNKLIIDIILNKYNNPGVKIVTFDNTILCDPNGRTCTPGLYVAENMNVGICKCFPLLGQYYFYVDNEPCRIYSCMYSK